MRFAFLILAGMTTAAHATQSTSDLAVDIFRQEIKAQSTEAPAVSVGETPKTTGTPKTTSPSGVPSMGGNSINPAAAQGQQSQSSGAGINAAAGAALIAAGMAPKPPNMALIAMGIMALMQAGHDSGAAGQSADTFDISKYDTGLNTNPGTDGKAKDPTKGSGGFTSASVEAGKAALQEAGYKVTEKGVTSPDGTFTPAAGFGSPSSLANAGFDPNAVREATKVTGALNDEVSKLSAGRVSGVGVNGGGGAGGDAGSGDGGGSSDYSAGAGGAPGGAGGAFDKRKMMAGKTVNFDGEPIGVRGNNIFDMVHECYQKKRAGKHFIEVEGGGGAPVRMPASLPGSKRK